MNTPVTPGRNGLPAWREAWRRHRAFRDAWPTLRPHDRARYTDPRWAESRRRLTAFAGIHAGRRAFLIGNGPSLARMDLSPLRNEITFGLNRIYLNFERMGFQTTYHVVVNQLVIEQCASDLDALTLPQFVNWRSRDKLAFHDNQMFLFDPYDGSLAFAREPLELCWEGATVTYAAMQLAFFMGITELVLIGVDHSFATQGTPHKVVVSEGDDPDHFDPTYFGKGFRWQLPDLENSELAYRLAAYHYRLAGREILDATVGGKLEVFPKVAFAGLFSGGGDKPVTSP